MFRTYLYGRRRDVVGVGLLIIVAILWFAIDRPLSKPPDLSRGVYNLKMQYGFEFTTMAEAKEQLPALMADYMFYKIIPAMNGNGIVFLYLVFAGLLLARPLGLPTAQLPLRCGVSRTGHVLMNSAIFYLTLILIYSIQFVLHLFQNGVASFPYYHWGWLLWMWLYTAIIICGITSVTTMFAFATQSMLYTTLLSFLYIAIMVVLKAVPVFAPVHPLVPLLRGFQAGIPPYDLSRQLLDVLISVAWIVGSFVLSCLVYRRRNVLAERL